MTNPLMCGVAGVIADIQSAGWKTQGCVEEMLRHLRHRGPDSFVVKAWDHVCFGHCRLSIVDLSDAANQPMSYADGRYWITYNGEVYNFVELRRELEQKGYRFKTHSDTEVIVAAYDAWGRECLSHFNGMWGFAIYDRRERACFLARDRFGVKPLYYAEHDGCLLFASEMKALLAAGVPSDPDLETIRWYFHDAGCDRGDLTPFKAIRQLPAGHYMIVKNGHYSIHRWWETLDNRVKVPPKFRDRAAEFRALLEDAVRIRLRNDVETAVTLSGGMDSSSIYALSKVLQQRNEVVTSTEGRAKHVRVFSVSYPGQPVDERPYVEECLRAYGDEATFIFPTPEDFPRLLNEVIWHQESFVWNASVFAYHLIYRQIAQAGIRVVLEGHGSDEMLAGYPSMVYSALCAFRQKRDWWNVWQAARCLSRTPNPAIDETSQSAWRILLGQIPAVSRCWKLFKTALRHNSTGKKTSKTNGGMEPQRYLSKELCLPPTSHSSAAGEKILDPLQRDLYDAFHRRIEPNALRVFDRATMSSALESRSPFMDYRVVRYVFSLPISDIVGGGETKHILRQAVRDIVPSAVIGRRAKLGFSIAFRQWFNHPAVVNCLSEIIRDRTFAEHGLIDGAAFAEEFDRCARRGFSSQDTGRVWEVVSLSLWWKLFVSRQIRVANLSMDMG